MATTTHEASAASMDAKRNAFGLGHGGLSEFADGEDTEEQVETESEEAEQTEREEGEDPDTSEETQAEDAASDDEESKGADTDTEDDEQDAGNEDIAALTKKYQDADEHARKLQSRLDRQEAQHQREFGELWGQFEALKENMQAGQADDPLAGRDDGDVVSVGELRKMMASGGKRETAKPSSSGGLSGSQRAYLNRLPDYQDVVEHIRDNNLQHDPEISGIPTDTVGLVHAVRAKMLEGRLAAMQEEQKKAVEAARADERKKLSKSKGKIPPTGGGSGRGRQKVTDGGAGGPLTAFEQAFSNTFKKRGFERTDIRLVKR